MSLYKPSLQDLIDRAHELNNVGPYRYECNFVDHNDSDVDLDEVDNYHDDEIKYVTITSISPYLPDEITCYRYNNDGRFEVVENDPKYTVTEHFSDYK